MRSKIALVLIIALIGAAVIGFADSRQNQNNQGSDNNNQGNDNAQGCNKNHPCPSDNNPCTTDSCVEGECVYNFNTDLCTGGQCIEGVCCPTTRICNGACCDNYDGCCGGVCTDLGTTSNCEHCGDVCPGGEVCDFHGDGCVISCNGDPCSEGEVCTTTGCCDSENACGNSCGCGTGTVCCGESCVNRLGLGDQCVTSCECQPLDCFGTCG